MSRPPIGRVVQYVTKTPYGLYVLPAVIMGWEEEDLAEIRIHTDEGGSEWITHAKRDPNKAPRTWHEMPGE